MPESSGLRGSCPAPDVVNYLTNHCYYYRTYSLTHLKLGRAVSLLSSRLAGVCGKQNKTKQKTTSSVVSSLTPCPLFPCGKTTLKATCNIGHRCYRPGGMKEKAKVKICLTSPHFQLPLLPPIGHPTRSIFNSGE